MEGSRSVIPRRKRAESSRWPALWTLALSILRGPSISTLTSPPSPKLWQRHTFIGEPWGEGEEEVKREEVEIRKERRGEELESRKERER